MDSAHRSTRARRALFIVIDAFVVAIGIWTGGFAGGFLAALAVVQVILDGTRA